MQAVIEAAGKWKEREFQIGDTHFRVQKLLVMEAFELLEEMRSMVGRNLHVLRMLPDNSPAAVHIGSLLLALSPGDLEIVRRKLFVGVRFKNSLAKTWRDLNAGGEGMAFQNLGPLKVYEVTARAFAVNFTESIQEIRSTLEFLGLSTEPREPQTSQDQSPEESPPDTSAPGS